LIAAEPITSDRYQEVTERGSAAFRSSIPPIAGFELSVMAHTIGKLEEGEHHTGGCRWRGECAAWLAVSVEL
jgi:hypothetical protein